MVYGSSDWLGRQLICTMHRLSAIAPLCPFDVFCSMTQLRLEISASKWNVVTVSQLTCGRVVTMTWSELVGTLSR